MRILIAEDDPHLGPSLKKGLEDNHYAVDLFTDGEEAISLALAVAYNLIILDRNITVKSEVGRGTTFTVALPLAD